MHTAPVNRFVARFSILAFGIMTLLAASAAAQGFGFHGGGSVAPRGVPASVTSFGFGGHPGFHGVPASVTSQGFGANQNFRGFRGGVAPVAFGGGRRGFHQQSFDFRRHHRDRFLAYSPFYGGYYDPYPYPYADYPPNDDYAEDPSYDSRATRDYDDRQALNDDYRAELSTSRQQQTQAPTDPVTAQPSTVLIFKDGHQQEVSNYAIVGATLYDLGDGRSKKVQLSDLDLTATIKENDQRRVEFQLPAETKFN